MKVCGVCGDKALGHNFKAISCESCKAFFRRNAHFTNKFKCPFTGNCKITPITRKFCQECRLNKCFEIGMCKNMIMSDEDKVLKRRKIEENRVKREQIQTSRTKKKIRKIEEQLNDNNNTVSSSSSDDTPFIRTLLTQENICDSITLLDSIMAPTISEDNDIKSENIIEKDIAKDVIQDINSSNKDSDDLNAIDAVLYEAIKLEYQTCTHLISNTMHSQELNSVETAKLDELIMANRTLLTPVDNELNNFSSIEDCKFLTLLQCNPQQALEADPALVDVINLTSIVIKRLIKMAKKISAFKNMCQEDQVALLKGGCTEIMILRSAMNYDHTKQTWKIPHSQETLNLNVDVLKLAKGNIYQEHENFIRTFDPRWRSDENIVLILCAITLFTPERPKVVHRDVVKYEQNSYYYLLRRYLESVYKGCEAKSTFLKLMQKIIELHKLNEALINVYLDVNPSQVEPLLIEIFDLNH